MNTTVETNLTMGVNEPLSTPMNDIDSLKGILVVLVLGLGAFYFTNKTTLLQDLGILLALIGLAIAYSLVNAVIDKVALWAYCDAHQQFSGRINSLIDEVIVDLPLGADGPMPSKNDLTTEQMERLKLRIDTLEEARALLNTYSPPPYPHHQSWYSHDMDIVRKNYKLGACSRSIPAPEQI